MDKNVVIKIEGLNKKFCRTLKRSLWYGLVDVARDMFAVSYDRSKLRPGEFWSLKNINFELKKGEALGIVGKNGSGKTTLLRLINGIFPPDSGKISIKGRMGALIAVGAGFHPHMTGRENIYLNGTIIGMTRKEIDEKFQDIIDFADIGDFIDAPVSTYSSGMTVRLGFSIAIHSNPDILLADEVLAVGDLTFALKCYRKIGEFRDNGGSIILVSHGMQLIRNTCQKVLWIENGVTKRYGATQEICDEYEQYMAKKDSDTKEKGVVINNDPLVRITNVEFLDKDNQTKKEHSVGELFKTRIYFECKRKVIKPNFTVQFFNPENIQIVSNFTNFDNFNLESLVGEGHVDFIIDKLFLKPGEYKIIVTLTENGDLNNNLEWHDKVYSFVVVPNGYVSYGLVNAFPKWEVNMK